jgi:SAM-dependent methyltransferase
VGFHGIVDACTDIEVRGWAWDSDRPDDPLLLDVSIDGTHVASLFADQFGADLAIAGMGNGLHRFVFNLSGSLPLEGRHNVSVSYQSTQLDNSPTWVAADILDMCSGLSLRDLMGMRLLRGEGIEIGALNNPQRVSKSCQVTYVDHLSHEELIPYYSEVDPVGLVPVGRIDDGETLGTFAAESVDFVIANNFLEHCEDTIGTLLNFLRVLRPRGIAFVTLPSQRQNVDQFRSPTTIEEFIGDHEVGSHLSRERSYQDWVRLVLRLPKDQVDSHAAELMAQDFRIHFHVFTEFEVLAVLQTLRDRYHEQFVIEGIVNDKDLEVAFAIRKV